MKHKATAKRLNGILDERTNQILSDRHSQEILDDMALGTIAWTLGDINDPSSLPELVQCLVTNKGGVF